MNRLLARMTKTKLAISIFVVLLLIAMGFSTKVVSLKEANDTFRTGTTSLQADQGKSKTFADKQWPETLAYVKSKAYDLSEIDKAIQSDLAAAGPKYGHTDGPGNAYSVPVKFTGVGSDQINDFLQMKVPGITGSVTVYMQVGPALNGTALRDVTGTVSFQNFVNQLAYQDASTKLNDIVRETVLKPYPPKSLVGKTIEVVGAMSLSNKTNYIIIPVELKVK